MSDEAAKHVLATVVSAMAVATMHFLDLIILYPPVLVRANVLGLVIVKKILSFSLTDIPVF
jgi:hypothetical protein